MNICKFDLLGLGLGSGMGLLILIIYRFFGFGFVFGSICIESFFWIKFIKLHMSVFSYVLVQL